MIKCLYFPSSLANDGREHGSLSALQFSNDLVPLQVVVVQECA